ncbi:hypothetical protein BB560_000405 [Smittium megazygosporum]|uniref:Uncharacterized protein n=1 Tax=Smittium megazygosporum TaxID=133381 RepID=A0A2T9ZKJ4_9FUNG|nr:hypothetical protein BB560_000405 [Smittium megazygosporum]
MFSFFNSLNPSLPQHRDPKEILSDASSCLEDGDYKGALNFFDELCKLPVLSALPFLSRATCKLQLEMYESAIEDCDKVLAFLNTDIDENIAEGCTTLHSAALLRQATAYKKIGNSEKAVSCMVRRDAIEAKFVERKKKSSSKQTTGLDVDNFTSSEEKDKLIAEQMRERGNRLYKKLDYKGALSEYRNALNLDMYNEKLHSNACLCLIQLDDLVMAKRHAHQCVDIQPNWAKGSYLLGKIAFLEKDYKTAEKNFKRSLELDPSNKIVKEAFNDLKNEMKKKSRSTSGQLTNRKTRKVVSETNSDPSNSVETDSDQNSSDYDNDKNKPITFKQYVKESLRSIDKGWVFEASGEALASFSGILITWAVVSFIK